MKLVMNKTKVSTKVERTEGKITRVLVTLPNSETPFANIGLPTDWLNTPEADPIKVGASVYAHFSN